MPKSWAEPFSLFLKVSQILLLYEIALMKEAFRFLESIG